jgi:hypothetical protein
MIVARRRALDRLAKEAAVKRDGEWIATEHHHGNEPPDCKFAVGVGCREDRRRARPSLRLPGT